MILVFVFDLLPLGMIISGLIHVTTNGIILFFLMAE